MPAISLIGLVGLVLTILCVAIAVFGPFFAPHRPSAILGAPFAQPSKHYPLGLDYLGRDAFSRYLWGGRTAVVLAFASTALGEVVGIFAGLWAAYLRGVVDALFNRSAEILLAFPSLILVLLLVTGVGTNFWLVVGAIGAAHAPRVGRIVRGAALDVTELAYVGVAEARGERRVHILLREILPNIVAPIMVDFAIRLAGSITLVAGLSFLGFGVQPPAADWGLIISENRIGLTVQPWAVVGPIATIGLLTVGLSLMADGIRRARALPEVQEASDLGR
jgi:peptide/nickel transport system permease protein